MGTPLKNPPVYFTLVQVRFNPILKLAAYLDSIQEGFRRSGFPAFESHMGFGLKIVSMEDGRPKPEPQQHQRYVFGTLDKKCSFLLENNALTLQSTEYGHFEQFADKFEKGLELVHKEVTINFIERIGLRYLDRVVPLGAEDSLSDYLASEVMGFHKRLGGNPAHSYFETVTEQDGKMLVSRVLIRSSGLEFPPDIGPTGLVVNNRFLGPAVLNAMLDTDGFVEARVPYSNAKVRQTLDAIHGVISDAFKAITTNHARKKWDE